MPRGSEIGVRKAIARLVDQGIVTATKMGRNVVHELNRDHIAAPVADTLASLRNELRRLRETSTKWEVKPVYACLFGSAARRDGGPDSDIDLMVVHPTMPGDKRTRRRQKSPLDFSGDLALVALASQASLVGSNKKWITQIDELRGKVQRWKGDQLQVIDIPIWRWADLAKSDSSLYGEVSRDAVNVAGQSIIQVLRSKGS